MLTCKKKRAKQAGVFEKYTDDKNTLQPAGIGIV